MDLPPVYCRALRHMEVYSLLGPLSKRIGTKTGLASLARKDAALAKHLPGTFMWNPVTGELDENASREEWERFWALVDAQGGERKFVVKVDNTSRGRGVHIVSRRDDLSPQLRYRLMQSSCVAQSYVDRPCLLQGHKWDMRVYVLVTVAGATREPRAFRYHEGFARRCTNKYQMAVNDRRAHLTNTSVNNSDGDRGLLEYSLTLLQALRGLDESEHALYPSVLMDEEDIVAALEKFAVQDEERAAEERAPETSSEVSGDEAGKEATKEQLPVTMRLSQAWEELQRNFSLNQIDAAKRSVDELIRDALGATFRVASQQTDPALPNTPRYTYGRHLMILGFDVLFDADLKPYLLEVNRFPDMTCYTRDQLAIKQELLRDTLNLVFPDARVDSLFNTPRDAQAMCDFWAQVNPSIDPVNVDNAASPTLSQDHEHWTEVVFNHEQT
ncbi:Tubulin polyglutamylase TTLL7 [Hondaea fermentalgiana]|uniref:Tubulin polyglutamylase TTLL7 n=1 Tax=Hondaea fermentalgiana TaxID=2315210 RepID=A0A2R5GWY1_9STRA|nr:Tubulin polyglutamylase TTLL7 [Hondaea fermentalgiana]|eukprot:GBG34839.1 Tubulin polyglutamylase TTLL7 [Hondaea fermentalgiana]